MNNLSRWNRIQRRQILGKNIQLKEQKRGYWINIWWEKIASCSSNWKQKNRAVPAVRVSAGCWSLRLPRFPRNRSGSCRRYNVRSRNTGTRVPDWFSEPPDTEIARLPFSELWRHSWPLQAKDCYVCLSFTPPMQAEQNSRLQTMPPNPLLLLLDLSGSNTRHSM